MKQKKVVSTTQYTQSLTFLIKYIWSQYDAFIFLQTAKSVLKYFCSK